MKEQRIKVVMKPGVQWLNSLGEMHVFFNGEEINVTRLAVGASVNGFTMVTLEIPALVEWVVGEEE